MDPNFSGPTVKLVKLAGRFLLRYSSYLSLTKSTSKSWITCVHIAQNSWDTYILLLVLMLPTWMMLLFQLLYSILTVFALLVAPCKGQLVKRNSTGLTDVVTWDPHSLSIFGQRVFILSAEFHPWRQPNPNLWRDIFQKIKANGFNTVSFYVNWAVHFPTPDSQDFEAGTYRDIQRFIDEAHAAGLWMIARSFTLAVTFLLLITHSGPVHI